MQIIAVHGGDSGIGTTMLAQSLCESLAQKGEKILYIDASDTLFDGYTGCSFELSGIDQIGRTINPFQAITPLDTFDIIPGIRGLSHRDYNDDFFPEIFRLADGYSRVIIDAGSDPRSRLCLQALKNADKRIYMVRQNPKCIDKFKLAAENIFMPQGAYEKQDIIVINALRKSRMLYTKESVEAALLRNTYTLPFIPDGIKCEYKKISLYEFSHKYRKAVDNIINKDL